MSSQDTIKLYMVEADTAPARVFTMKRAGAAIDLTGVTAKFVIRDTSTNLITNAAHQGCVVDPDQVNNKGNITYTFQAGDIASGNIHLCDVVLTYADSHIETEYGYVTIYARPKAGTIS